MPAGISGKRGSFERQFTVVSSQFSVISLGTNLRQEDIVACGLSRVQVSVPHPGGAESEGASEALGGLAGDPGAEAGAYLLFCGEEWLEDALACAAETPGPSSALFHLSY